VLPECITARRKGLNGAAFLFDSLVVVQVPFRKDEAQSYRK